VNIVVAVAILIVADAIAIGAILLVRRRAPEGSYFTDGDRASGVFGVLATCFAIFAGFVIFLSFTSYDQSRTGSETEALVVAQQFETAQFLPDATRVALGGQLTCYARYVVGQEWPEMESGVKSNAINPWSVAMFQSIHAANPKTGPQQSGFDKWLDQTSSREEARRDRIHGASGIIPTSLWIILLLTAGVIFAYMLFFADSAEQKRSQAMLIGSATTVVVVTVLGIYKLDNPYAPGLGQIKPTAMTRTVSLIDQARAVVGDTSEPPCDAVGTSR
jgi:hypothetical protein